MEVITVTSTDQNAANFTSSFINSVHLADGYQIALLKIACPPIFNVTESNNKAYIGRKDNPKAIKMIEIPNGFYPTTHDVTQALHDALHHHENFNDLMDLTDFINENLGDDEGQEEQEDETVQEEENDYDVTSNIRYVSSSGALDNSKIVLQLNDKKNVFVADSQYNDNILQLMQFKVSSFTTRTLLIQNYDLVAEDLICFVYCSIVSNSIIDDHVSRLLDTISVKTSKNGGYYIHEVKNPVFHNVSASSFIDISFQFRDINGAFVKFDQNFPIIITLGINKND